MNIEEAYQLLGLSAGASRLEVKKAYRNIQKELEHQASLASSAINKQIYLQELQRLEQCHSVLIPELDDSTDHPGDAMASTSPQTNKLSVMATALTLTFIATVLLTGKVTDQWQTDRLGQRDESSYYQVASAQSEQDQTTSSAIVIADDTKAGQAEQNAVSRHDASLTASPQAASFSAASNHDHSKHTAVAQAMSLYADVRARYQALLDTARIAVSKKLNGNDVVTGWSNHLVGVADTESTRGEKLKRLLKHSDNHLDGTMLDEANKGYIGISRQYDDVVTNESSLDSQRQLAEDIREKWAQYKQNNQLTGEAVVGIDKHFNDARAFEQEGRLSDAVTAYQHAVTAYQNALASGAQLKAKQAWLNRMRKRIAEIEAEEQQGASSSAQQVINNDLTQIPDPAAPAGSHLPSNADVSVMSLPTVQISNGIDSYDMQGSTGVSQMHMQ